MKERPILFTGAMVRALLAGTKTQTRRMVKPQPSFFGSMTSPNAPFKTLDAGLHCPILCPYGEPGDRLWVRETFSGPYCMEKQDECAAMPPGKWGESSRIWYWADGEPDAYDWTRPRPSIHMPRWASRIALEVTGVRVERLQEISEDNARAEGARECDPVSGREVLLAGPSQRGSYVLHYRDIWEQINGPDSWALNPWVWVVEFRRLAS